MTIFEAIQKGDTETVNQLLQADPKLVNKRDARGISPLTLATYLGNVEMTKVILSHDPYLETQDKLGNTALMGVCFKGDEDIAFLLIEAGANVNSKNLNKTTPLSFAAQHNQINIVKLLLQYKANPTVKDQKKMTPYDHANAKGWKDIADLLKK